MNEITLFCVIGIAALVFCIFTDIKTMRSNMEHKIRCIIRIAFCSVAVVLLAVILAGQI